MTRMLPAKLWFRIVEQASRVERMDYGRHPIYMRVDSWIENDVRLRSCSKEAGTVQWIESCFSPGDVFYDIGANVGAYSLVAFRFLDENVRIYAFEPGFVTFPQLCRNIHLNGAGKAIIPLQLALSNQTSITSFHYHNLFSGGALHALGDPLDQHGNKFQPVFTVPTFSYRLDDFVRQFCLPFPNHMKIDVDGTEQNILMGAGEIMSRPELKTILIEVDEESTAGEITRVVEKNGFVAHRRLNENILFVSNQYSA